MRGLNHNKIGWIYFIRVHEYVKIGYSSKYPTTRIAGIQSSCPCEIKLIRIIQGTLRTERWLHNKFTHKLHRGEWFNFDDEMETIIPPTNLQNKPAKYPKEYYASNLENLEAALINDTFLKRV